MMLHSDSNRLFTRLLMQAADTLCGSRLVMSHEGGYSASLLPLRREYPGSKSRVFRETVVPRYCTLETPQARGRSSGQDS